MNHPIDQYPLITHACYSTKETQANSYQLGYEAEWHNVEGDIVECGIAGGGNFAFMMLGCLSANPSTSKTFWGYDSFQGIQLAGSKDTEQAGIGAITHNTNVPLCELLKSSGITVHPKEEVNNNLHRWGLAQKVRYKLIEGWVQNTMDSMQPDKISVLRLDMDVYDPTIFVLRQLYDKISVGGFIIIDDWALKGVEVAVREFWEEMGIQPEIKTIKNSTPIYWVKE